MDAPPAPVESVSTESVAEAIQRGIQFLLADQNEDGSWGSPHRTKGLNIYAPVPGAHHAFGAAVTSLCLSAMLETGNGSPHAKVAIERGEAWLLENLPQVRRADPTALYNTWAHAYAIQALVRLLHRPSHAARNERKITKLIRIQIDFLRRYESVDGGWGYYDFRAHTRKPSSDSTSFLTATALVALHEARSAGISVPSDLTERAIASVRRQQKADFSYLYGEYLRWHPMLDINRPGGSLGRSQACNLALRLWDDPKITDDVIRAWLDRLLARNDWLSMGRKRPIPHESWFSVAGYFFYYGHYYAALDIEQLPPRDQERYRPGLANILVPLQEKDGSWWDYPLYNYHQQYGTAFALMSLHRCRENPQQASPLRPNN
ncbi:MAG: terpene cyclase/mutase family protein [Planctomycetes bacterium]|nr:terpene cyclase/mutase family protein [Planctomycetota bacterium]